MSVWAQVDRWCGADPTKNLDYTLRARIALAVCLMVMTMAGANAFLLSVMDAARPGMVLSSLTVTGVTGLLTLLIVKLRRPNTVLGLVGLLLVAGYAVAAWGNRGTLPPVTLYLTPLVFGYFLAWGVRALFALIPAIGLYLGAVFFFSIRYAELVAVIEPRAQIALHASAAVLAIAWTFAFGSIFRSATLELTRRLTDQNHELEDAVFRSESASRAKSEFLANVGHEIRTPLNGVLGMTNVLLHDGELSPEQERRLRLINESGDTLLELLNDILDLSKIEAGALELEAIPFDLRQLLTSTTELWRAEAEDKGLDFALSEEEMTHSALIGDPVRLRQILNNLLGNALKFTAKGEIIVRVKQTPGETGVRTEIAVSDTGIGIPADKQATIFDSFSQVDTSIRRSYGGTGLGLAISSQLAQKMGGTLTLRSRPGSGSVFTLTLETPIAEDLPEAASVAETGRIETVEPLNILLVDDVPTNLIVLKALTEQGFGAVKPQIDLAGGGREAVNLCATRTYDIILMDIQMPEMDGVTAMRCIRETRLNAETRIIAVTALTSEENREALNAEGFAGHLGKPVNAAELQAMLARHGAEMAAN